MSLLNYFTIEQLCALYKRSCSSCLWIRSAKPILCDIKYDCIHRPYDCTVSIIIGYSHVHLVLWFIWYSAAVLIQIQSKKREIKSRQLCMEDTTHCVSCHSSVRQRNDGMLFLSYHSISVRRSRAAQDASVFFFILPGGKRAPVTKTALFKFSWVTPLSAKLVFIALAQ